MWSIALLASVGVFTVQGASLHDQSVQRLLAQRFTEEDISYLLLDAGSGKITAQRWPDSTTPIPLGSLVKPFLALAYSGNYPTYTCAGCWLPGGHGKIGISQAIAQSCNAYFLTLAGHVPLEDLQTIARRFGIGQPSIDSAEAKIGMGSSWRIAPVAMMRAYLSLVRRADDPAVAPLLTGMALSAKSGTSKAIGGGVLAKTGTAPCTHRRRMPGDGYTIALYPPESPRFVLLVRAHGAPGALAAVTAAQMLRTIREGK